MGDMQRINDDFILLHAIHDESPILVRTSEIRTAWKTTLGDLTGTRLELLNDSTYLDVIETVEEVAETIRKSQKFVVETPYPVLR